MLSYYLQRGHTLDYLLTLDDTGKAWHYASMMVTMDEQKAMWERR